MIRVLCKCERFGLRCETPYGDRPREHDMQTGEERSAEPRRLHHRDARDLPLHVRAAAREHVTEAHERGWIDSFDAVCIEIRRVRRSAIELELDRRADVAQV